VEFRGSPRGFRRGKGRLRGKMAQGLNAHQVAQKPWGMAADLGLAATGAVSAAG
jgi:hypothetical protein